MMEKGEGLMRKVISVLMSVFVSGCMDVPEGITPIDDFELQNYMGKWYEIARLDHRFERGMSRVTAEYTLREEGGVYVTNRGYLSQKSQWKDARGKAFLVGEPNVGHLKVSFFGPFYGSYIIYALDEDRGHAFISGSNKNYLWFLSRTPTVSQEVRARFVDQAQALGFDTSQLIFVEHQ